MARAAPESQHFAILRHNFRTGQSEAVTHAVKGRDEAEALTDLLNAQMTASDSAAGWRWMLKPTSRAAAKPHLKPRRRWSTGKRRRRR
jgi:hypothetical protein